MQEPQKEQQQPGAEVPNDLENQEGYDVGKPIKVIVKYQDKQLLETEFSQQDVIIELKQLLGESTQSFLWTSYHFEYNQQRINEYAEIKTYCEDKEEIIINVVHDPYNEKNARTHVKKVQEVIQDPSVAQQLISNQLLLGQSNALKGLQDEESKTGEDANKESSQMSSTFQLSDALNCDLSKYPLVSQEKKESGLKREDVRCLNYICYSGFNPPPPNRKLAGDLFYLQVKLLEGNEYHITASSFGFAVNQSNSKYFDPIPQPKAITYYSLVDLMSHYSSLFKKQYQILFSQSPSLDLLTQSPVNTFIYNNKWLSSSEELQQHDWNATRTESFLQNLHGVDPSSLRDWNDEYQSIKELPKKDLIQRLNSDKLMVKVLNDFVEAAIEGAKAVVDGFVTPLNPTDKPEEYVYIYNSIFFSLADNTIDSYRDSGAETIATRTMTNYDLLNVKILHKRDIQELHVLNTALVDYAGRRIVAQAVVPGVITSNQKQCTEYGSIDEGKNIYCNDEFKEIMKKVCQLFSIADSIDFVDEKAETHNLAGSYEIKGIRGSDRRKYFIELIRLLPRDINYTAEGHEHLCCIHRPELVQKFLLYKFTEAEAINQMKVQQERAKQQKEGTEKEKEEQTEDTQQKEEEQAESNMLKLAQKYKFNTCLYTKAQYVLTESHENDKKLLEELADFVKTKVIPSLVQELSTNDISPICDSKSVSEFFHMSGISMRYLGEVIRQCNSNKDQRHVKNLLERVVLTRTLKNIMRKKMSELNFMQIPKYIGLVFNTIFSSPEDKSYLEGLENQEDIFKQKETQSQQQKQQGQQAQQQQQKQEQEQEREQDEVDQKDKSKKKKKKSKQNQKTTGTGDDVALLAQQNLFKVIQPQFKLETVTVKPSELWNEIVHIAKKRYSHEFTETLDKLVFQQKASYKYALLREVCLSLGIVLKCRDYFSIHSANEQGQQRREKKKEEQAYSPVFRLEDIVEVRPLVKYIDHTCEDSLYHIDYAQKRLYEGKVNEALEAYQTCIQILINIYGPAHKDIASIYQKMAQIHLRIGNLEEAIFNQKQATIINEKLYGLDHAVTAQSYYKLGLIYFSIKEIDSAFKMLFKSLYIYNLICGENNLNSVIVLMNLSVFYRESEQYQASISCLYEALERSIATFGEESAYLIGCYQGLALAHYEIEDFNKSIDYQNKCISILKKYFSDEDIKVKDATMLLNKFKSSLEDKKKQKLGKPGENKRPFGSNKPQKPNQQKDDQEDAGQLSQFKNEQRQKERQLLIQKARAMRMSQKQGGNLRPQFQNADILNYMYQNQLLTRMKETEEEKKE